MKEDQAVGAYCASVLWAVAFAVWSGGEWKLAVLWLFNRESLIAEGFGIPSHGLSVSAILANPEWCGQIPCCASKAREVWEEQGSWPVTESTQVTGRRRCGVSHRQAAPEHMVRCSYCPPTFLGTGH